MARMIPDNVTPDDFHGSVGEEKVYEALKALPQEYTIFHSVHWHKKNQHGNVVWGESDFTVLNPKRGIIVIEVKSGGIRHNESGWTQVNTLNSEEYHMKDPLAQAERSKFTFVDILESNAENYHTYWVESAVWFPSVDNVRSVGALPPAYAMNIVLAENDLGSAKRSIERIFDYYQMDEKPFYNGDDEAHVITTLSPSFYVIPSMATRISEEEYVFNRMTQEQGYLLDYLDEQMVAAIQGGAGTGKTMLAIEKAKRLSASGKVLFLCFNKFLLDMLKHTYAESYPNIDFYNLHGLVCCNTGLPFVGGNEEISDFLLSIESNEWPYSHIVIDEGQDFYEDHLILLAAIAEHTDGCFYVFYDKNQLVQQRQSFNWVNSVECRLVLSANCRNTRNIAVTSNIPVGIEKIKMRFDVLGDKPNLYIAKSKTEAVDYLAKVIRHYTDNGLNKRDIVILTVKTEESSILAGLSSVGPYRLSSELYSKGILFTSARKFKGLESDVVIIVDMDEKSFENGEAKRVLYVGASRAKHYLDFVSVMNDTQLSQLALALQGRTAKSAKLVISSQLKVRIVVL